MTQLNLISVLVLALLLGEAIFLLRNRSFVRKQKSRKIEQRWQLAIEGSGQGFWDWHAQTNRTFISRRWKRSS